MWIASKIGFFSIVAHRDQPGFVMIRARIKGDLIFVQDGEPAFGAGKRIELEADKVPARVIGLLDAVDAHRRTEWIEDAGHEQGEEPLR